MAQTNTLEAAQADYDKAKDHYEHFLKGKFGADWQAHYGDYTYDMGACIGRTFFRGVHETAQGLEAAKAADATQ
jgi:hypothetical protein